MSNVLSLILLSLLCRKKYHSFLQEEPLKINIQNPDIFWAQTPTTSGVEKNAILLATKCN